MFVNCTFNLKIAGEFFNRHAVNQLGPAHGLRSSYLKIGYSHGLKDCRFMFYFTFLPEFYCTFPSRYLLHYRFIKQYLVLRGGPRWFTQNFTCSMLLGKKNGTMPLVQKEIQWSGTYNVHSCIKHSIFPVVLESWSLFLLLEVMILISLTIPTNIISQRL